MSEVKLALIKQWKTNKTGLFCAVVMCAYTYFMIFHFDRNWFN